MANAIRNGTYSGARALVAFLLILALGSCAVQLAPEYDKSIIEKLNEANTETLTLLASISNGAEPSTYAEREKSYNNIIGQFDALRLQVAARPVPRSLVADMFGFGPEDTEMRDIQNKDDLPKIDLLGGPSESILIEILETLTRIRDTDKKGTLDKNKIGPDGGLRNAYEISFRQVLTYEMALDR